MELGRMFSRSLNDLVKNPVLILPRVVEVVLDIIILLVVLIIASFLMMDSIKYLLNQDYFGVIQSVSFYKIGFIILLVMFFIFAVYFLSSLARAAIIGMSKEVVEKGSTSIKTGFETALRYGTDIFLFLVLLGLFSIALFIISLIPIILGVLLEASDTFIVVGYLSALFLMISIFLIAYVFVFLTPQHIVLKDAGVLKGVNQSISFVRGNLVYVIIYGIMAIGISIVISLVPMLIFLPVDFLTRQVTFLNLGINILYNIISVIISLLIATYLEIVKTRMVYEENEVTEMTEVNEVNEVTETNEVVLT
jgi:hypothetical protein